MPGGNADAQLTVSASPDKTKSHTPRSGFGQTTQHFLSVGVFLALAIGVGLSKEIIGGFNLVI